MSHTHLQKHRVPWHAWACSHLLFSVASGLTACCAFKQDVTWHELPFRELGTHCPAWCRETGPPRPYQECSSNPYTVFVLTAHGGHCAHLPLGSWVTGKAWMDTVAMQFFSAVRVLSAKPGGPLHVFRESSSGSEQVSRSSSQDDPGHL